MFVNPEFMVQFSQMAVFMIVVKSIKTKTLLPQYFGLHNYAALARLQLGGDIPLESNYY